METRIEKIKGILEDYYTPERVDVFRNPNENDIGRKPYCVLIWFPAVTVTNEHNQSIDIQDLFIRFYLSSDGRLVGTFEMGRTTFSRLQAQADYIHSHCGGRVIPGVNQFYHCCLGSGPLVSTCASLNREYDEGIWTLFCGELDLYTKTESETGVPYRYLNQVGKSNNSMFSRLKYVVEGYFPQWDALYIEVLNNVIEDGNLPMTYNNGHYSFAVPDIDVALEINRQFFKVYDDYVAHRRRSRIPNYSIYNAILADGRIYNQGSYRNVEQSNFADSYIEFKGERKYVRIIGDEQEQDNSFRFVEPNLICWLASILLEIVNTKLNI